MVKVWRCSSIPGQVSKPTQPAIESGTGGDSPRTRPAFPSPPIVPIVLCFSVLTSTVSRAAFELERFYTTILQPAEDSTLQSPEDSATTRRALIGLMLSLPRSAKKLSTARAQQHLKLCVLVFDRLPPNKRLKLSGGDRSKGSGVFVPWRARTIVNDSCASGRVARSLSAIR